MPETGGQGFVKGSTRSAGTKMYGEEICHHVNTFAMKQNYM